MSRKKIKPIRINYAKGTVMLLLCIVSILLAAWVHDGFFALVSVFLCTLLLTCLLQLVVCKRHLSFTYAAQTYSCERGAQLVLQCPMNVRALRAYAHFVMEYTYSNDGKHARRCLVSGQDTGGLEIKINAQYVGNYYFGIGAIYVSDLLGIFYRRIKFALPEKANLHIYPKCGMLPMDKSGAMQAVEAKFNTIRDSYSLNAPKEYNVGDALHMVDWKTTARKRKLYVKDFSSDSANVLEILVIPPWEAELEARTIFAELIYTMATEAFLLGVDGIKLVYGATSQRFNAATAAALRGFLVAFYALDEGESAQQKTGNIISQYSASTLAILLPASASESILSKINHFSNTTIIVVGEAQLVSEQAVWIKGMEQWNKINQR